MPKHYYTYRLQVTNRERVRVEKRDSDYELIEEPSSNLQLAALTAIEPLIAAANEGTLKDKKGCRQLGEGLFSFLFDPVLRQNFVDFYQKVVRQEKAYLRIELDIDEHTLPDLAALPWEFMTLPESANLSEIWLATDPNLVFSRRRSQWHPALPIPLLPGEKLRIALAISAPASPEGLGKVEYQRIEDTLCKLAEKQSDRIELLPIVKQATIEAINELLEQQPHIFHFIGHGQFQASDNEEVGQIALVDDVFDEALWVGDSFFSNLFARWQPGIVVLQACEGGKLSSFQSFSGVASKLVQRNIPVVLAMQYPVRNTTASYFSYKFYECLANDKPVDVAAQEGRNSIATRTQFKGSDFATPMIFMRVQEGYLFKEIEWQTLHLDEESIRRNIRLVNTSLQDLNNAEYINNLTSEDYEELLRMNEDIKNLQEFDKKLERLADTAKKVLVKAIENLDNKLQSLSETLGNDIEKSATQEELKSWKKYKTNLEEAAVIADWIDSNLDIYAASSGKFAIENIFEETRDLNPERKDDFIFSVKQFLEHISFCLRWGNDKILENPRIFLELDQQVYKKAFERFREHILSSKKRFSDSALQQLDDYLETLNYKLKFYDRVQE